MGFGHDQAGNVLVAAARVGEAGEAPVASVIMSPQLADNLALLFDRFAESEFIVCVEGKVGRAGQLQLRDFRMPHHAYSRSQGAGIHSAGDCGQYAGVIGTLHNHPPAYPEDRGREWRNCYLSRTDILSWLEHTDYPYTMVMCGPRLWAWWHRSQVDSAKVLAFPPPGQVYGRTSEEGVPGS